ncbi:uncharacterized protein BO97DRAFT_474195 [Aspergillus homomorphus CBS 101889]|uniref:Altered inheritance of mitochondria protein 9, mitochondrial n=1 Tax=Aspergillus homomorphus (strain CBS 101889) TaxID=1450537 RepID=A0A395HG16_ASPHC|nr:hypothetical protein BO97DRAFT_474195 [Aspergillus homomorphus CBS 101889]RAL06576.1 hypothetical protein BO97DRAFT_474195 [Aspergillus homomorphus CBS 101889]
MAVPRIIRSKLSKCVKNMQSELQPVLFRTLTDGSEIPIEECDLFGYQRYRWLNGESKELARRYLKFDLRQLVHTSIQAIGGDGLQCTKVSKCVEGQFNKAFVLTMSNGDEVVARLPNPNAGPAFYTIASEVATRQFIREIMGLPVPKIYTWSSDSSNPVGSEYILEEKARGQALGKLWAQMSMPSRCEIIDQVINIEKKLTSVSFSKHGCIYHTSVLSSKIPVYDSLDSMLDSASLPEVRQTSKLSRFTIGPSNDRRMWQSERKFLKLDWGPWSNPADYAMALGKNELSWAQSQARPRINPYRSIDKPESPEEYRSLLERYLRISPYLIPGPETGEPLNTLSHPDLHLDNIFIDPDTNQITSIIDWQLAAVAPICLQRPHPQMLELSPSPRTSQQNLLEKELLKYYYEGTKNANNIRPRVSRNPYLTTRLDPLNLISGCWERQDTFSLREALIKIVALWTRLGYSSPCPVEFTEEELIEHQNERNLVQGLSTIVQQLADEGLIPIGGMVQPEEYEQARMVSDWAKREFISLAEDDHQEKLHMMVWPY